MPTEERYTPAQVIEALRVSAGIRSVAAAKLGCAPTTVTNYIDRYPEIATALVEIEEELLDLTEGKLLNLIRDGSERSIHFYLRTKGKKRGYVERAEVTGKDGKDLPPAGSGQVTIIQLPDNGRPPVVVEPTDDDDDEEEAG